MDQGDVQHDIGYTKKRDNTSKAGCPLKDTGHKIMVTLTYMTNTVEEMKTEGCLSKKMKWALTTVT